MARHRSVAGAVAVFVALAGLGTAEWAAAAPAEIKCRGAIVQAAVAMATLRTKALARCSDAEILGKLPSGACPDEKAVARVEKAREKFRGIVVKACGGKDKACGAGEEDDVPLSEIGWNIGTCAATGSTLCLDPIVDCRDVATCVDCVQSQAVDQAMALFYGPGFADPGGNAELRSCLRAVGKGGAKSLTKVAKGFGKCWLDVNKRDAGGSFSCPDRQASRTVGGARGAICTECGGPGGKCGGGNDLPVASIGFPADCPAIGVCAGPVQTVRDVAGCIDCVNAALMDAATRRTIPAFSLSSPPVCVP